MIGDQTTDRCFEVNAAVRSLAIVDIEPPWQGSVSLL